MTPQRQGKYPRFECPVCSGLYVADRELMETLGHKGDRRFEAVAKVKVANVADSTIRCPQDGTTLKAVKFLNTELDVCPKCHALWLDYGEYEKLFRRTDEEVRKLRGERQHRVVVEEIDVSEPVGFGDVFSFIGGVLDWARVWRRIL
jgi:Zn-finger nucleic acid-binding protein